MESAGLLDFKSTVFSNDYNDCKVPEHPSQDEDYILIIPNSSRWNVHEGDQKGPEVETAISLSPLPSDLLLGHGEGSLSSHFLVSLFFQQLPQFVHLPFSVAQLLLGF